MFAVGQLFDLWRDSDLLQQNQIPVVFWELHIHNGYRKPICTLKDCVRSAFRLNNETLNFWTHFVPLWYFVFQFRRFTSDEAFMATPYHYPFLAYLFTLCLYPLLSSTAHLFSVISERFRHLCFFVDYAGLSLYSFGASVAYFAYSFDSVFFHSSFSSIFLYLTAFNAIMCTTVACLSRFIYSTKPRKLLRCLAFVWPYAACSFPLLERIVHCYFSACPDEAIPQHTRQFVWSALMITIYGFHIPECFAPGFFDLVGHSHQIFHILSILASYDQLWAVYTDMTVRQSFLAKNDSLPDADWCVRAVALVVLLNLVILCTYALQVCCQSRLPQYESSADLHSIDLNHLRMGDPDSDDCFTEIPSRYPTGGSLLKPSDSIEANLVTLRSTKGAKKQL